MNALECAVRLSAARLHMREDLRRTASYGAQKPIPAEDIPVYADPAITAAYVRWWVCQMAEVSRG